MEDKFMSRRSLIKLLGNLYNMITKWSLVKSLLDYKIPFISKARLNSC
jgi:hypothetical protein